MRVAGGGVAALVLLAALGGCEKAGTPATGAPPSPATGSASAGSSAATDPDACSDAEIARRMDAGLVAVERYFGTMEKLVPGWTDCERARTDLVALAPDGARFQDSVMAMRAWADAIGPACRARAKAFGDTPAGAEKGAAMEKRFGGLEPAVEAVLERCKDHPGFQDAVSQGLRVMRKQPR